MSPVDVVWKLLGTIVGVFLDLLTFLQLTLRTLQAVAAENLFLRKQLALYVERKTKPHRATDAVRFTLAQLSRFFEWRDALTVVKPDTLIRWHRKGFRVFWKWKSRGDRNVPSCLCVRYHGNRHRRILHFNTTCHPTAEWTLQQFRECVTGEEPYKFIIHDRDSIYSKELDSSLRSLGLRVLRTPYRSPQANAFCERLIGSARRECLD